LTKGLSGLSDVDVLFVVPKVFGDEDQSKIRLIGADHVPVLCKEVHMEGFLKSLEKIEVGVNIYPYIDPETFKKFPVTQWLENNRYITTNTLGTLDFKGGYGADLLHEISKYAVVASTIAYENEFDVIHAHDWLTYPAGIVAREISGKPLVIHVHATDFDRSGGEVNPVVFDIEKSGMQAADQIITVSNLTRNIVIEKYGIDPEKVITVYNAVEPGGIKDDVAVERVLSDKIVTFLGRITMQKGPEYFVEAANLVLKKMSDVRFVMAGSGDMMSKMVRRAARLGITDRFHFTGFLRGDEVYRMLYMSDVYVMPSVSEPFGISPLEAMQSNVPVIISNQSGVAEVLRHAIKVDFWDTHAMADAIYGILSYPALHQFFSVHGKDEVDALKWENSAYQVREVYYRAIGIRK
jgi:glycosyltransferase involved in cell wall biosynthesis